MKKIVFAIFIVLPLITNIYAVETCTPSEEYEKYMALSDEEKKEYIEPAYCKEVMEKDDNESFLTSLFKNLTNTIEASSMDSSYNSVDDGIIGSPQNQGALGTCWAFSSISVVEANARKNNVGNYNLSEKHMIYSVLAAGYSDSAGKKGKYHTSNFNGGKVTYAASYFLNNYGQLLENEWSYSDQATQITSSNYKSGKNIINVSDFELSNIDNYSSCTSAEITYIKKQIIKHGSVQVSMYMDEGLFKDSAKDYYISTTLDSDLPNHGITIVGWDDNISKNKFGASRDGAFVIKNSWGPTWSNDGYFYISYDDNFVCKNVASFYGVSKKTFDNTYHSADMLGVPSIMFTGTFYTSAKFNKKTNDNYYEDISRVSFPVGADSNYYIYYVPDNNINSSSNWKLLTSGTSDVYGIKSVDLTGYRTVSDSFTIVAKYVANNSRGSSVFTMCTNVDDTSKMSISSGKNYISSNLNNWQDMKSIQIQNTTISCEPNIYVYTNSKQESSVDVGNGNIVINSITPDSTSTLNKKFTVNITNNNINTNYISYKITDSNGSSVTSSFTISPNYNTNKIIVESNGKVSGTFNFIIKYGSNEVVKTFNISDSISINNSSFITISGSDMYVNISNKEKLTYSKLINGLSVYNSDVQVIDKKGKTVTSSSSIIGTNTKLKTNSKTYLIVIPGDVNCDGSVSALDYIEIRKHIMGNKITNTGKLKASDLDNNGSVSALDYIAIRKVLMR